MSTITVKISSNTRRGKYISNLLIELAKTWKEIEIVHTPETIKAIKEPKPKKIN
jgi:hypothetical protein